MERWRFFLEADKREDLSHIDAARNWAHVSIFSGTGPLSAALMAITFSRPEPDDAGTWERSVRALRSVAGRMESFRGRPPGIGPREADEVMTGYVRMLHPVLLLGDRPLRSAERLRLLPNVPDRIGTFAESSSLFFAVVFGSLLRGFSDPICASCSRELPPSRSGKISRARRCRSCVRKAWWDRLDVKERREKEAQKKRRQRAEAKRGAK